MQDYTHTRLKMNGPKNVLSQHCGLQLILFTTLKKKMDVNEKYSQVLEQRSSQRTCINPPQYRWRLFTNCRRCKWNVADASTEDGFCYDLWCVPMTYVQVLRSFGELIYKCVCTGQAPPSGSTASAPNAISDRTTCRIFKEKTIVRWDVERTRQAF